jgi:hypothetical protein
MAPDTLQDRLQCTSRDRVRKPRINTAGRSSSRNL